MSNGAGRWEPKMLRLIAALVFGSTLSAQVALADSGTVLFHNGAVVHGDVSTQGPGQPITVRTADGVVTAYRVEDVRAVQRGVDGVAKAGDDASPSPMPGSPLVDPALGQLLYERDQVRSMRRTGLGLPIGFLASGGALVIVGTALFASGNSCVDCVDGGDLRGTGVDFLTVGAVLTAVGAALLPGRLMRRARRNARLREIDGELRLRGVQAGLSWGHGSPSRGFGLRLGAAF